MAGCPARAALLVVLAALHAAPAAGSDVLTGVAVGAGHFVETGIELTHNAAVVLADGGCRVATGIDEFAVSIVATGVMAQVETSATLLLGRYSATTIITAAVGVQCTGVTTRGAGIGGVVVAVVTDFIPFGVGL